MSKRAYKLKEIILPATSSRLMAEYPDRRDRTYLGKPKGPRHQPKRKNK